MARRHPSSAGGRPTIRPQMSTATTAPTTRWTDGRITGALVLLGLVMAVPFAAFGPVACAATGAILLANGLSRRE